MSQKMFPGFVVSFSCLEHSTHIHCLACKVIFRRFSMNAEQLMPEGTAAAKSVCEMCPSKH